MLMPKRTKYRKMMQGPDDRARPTAGSTIAFGEFGLQATGAGLDQQPPDRGCPPRDHQLPEARWQGLDSDLPGQAGDAEAGRNPHGFRQGQPGVLGRRGQAGPDHVRDRRRVRGSRPKRRCAAPAMKMPMDCRFVERAADRRRRRLERSEHVDEPRRRWRHEAGRDSRAGRRADSTSSSTELHAEWRNLRFQEAVGQLTATARIRQIRKDIARIHTIRTEREIERAWRCGRRQRRR